MPDFLRIIILNVGPGDSILLHSHNPEGDHWGIIDSNVVKTPEGKMVNPALEFLKREAVTSLSFLALTHLHLDHVCGLHEILDHFPVDEIHLSPQLGNDFEDFIHKKKSSFQKALKSLANGCHPRAEKDLAYLVYFLDRLKKRSNQNCFFHPGPGNLINPRGFGTPITLSIIQPMSRYKGQVYQRIRDGFIDLETPHPNYLSLAFKLSYHDHQVILGGDSPRESWLFREKSYSHGKAELVNMVKIPHHGSREDNSASVLNYFWGNDVKNSPESFAAIISADGITNPSIETLRNLSDIKVPPYCTNIHEECAHAQKDHISEFSSGSGLEPIIHEHLHLFDSFKKSKPCQGNIEITMTPTDIQISSEYQNFCPYRF